MAVAGRQRETAHRGAGEGSFPPGDRAVGEV